MTIDAFLRELRTTLNNRVAADPPPDPTADVRERIADVRGNLQKLGTAYGAVATAVLTGLGWTQIHQLFPLPPKAHWVPWVAGVSTVAAITGAAWIFLALFGAQRRIVLISDLDDKIMKKSLGRERALVRKLWAAEAAEVDAADLHQVELRAYRFKRLNRDDEAETLLAKVSEAQGHAAELVAEERARKAIGGWKTKAALMLAALGIAGIFASADYSKGQRDAAPQSKPSAVSSPKTMRAQLACTRAVAGLAGLKATTRATLAADCEK